MLKASCQKYILHFKEPAGTSRGILTEKETYFIRIWDTDSPDVCGIGECALFRGLSTEDSPVYENKLKGVCEQIDQLDVTDLREWSSIRLGVEMALADLKNGGCGICFPSDFTTGQRGININGLVWMGDKESMQRRMDEKIEAGFHCIKLKIGAIDFDAELDLLTTIREKYSRDEIEVRVDANGAFQPEEALEKLEILSRYGIHSIEQPIRSGQWEEMSRLCRLSPIPIALDEELIGVNDTYQKELLLDTIRPAYLVLKPALAGGFSGAKEWISLAEKRKTGWWITSALESNIGLNALAQWTATLYNPMPQGLGTGQLYTNNLPSSLQQRGEKLFYCPEKR